MDSEGVEGKERKEQFFFTVCLRLCASLSQVDASSSLNLGPVSQGTLPKPQKGAEKWSVSPAEVREGGREGVRGQEKLCEHGRMWE